MPANVRTNYTAGQASCVSPSLPKEKGLPPLPRSCSNFQVNLNQTALIQIRTAQREYQSGHYGQFFRTLPVCMGEVLWFSTTLKHNHLKATELAACRFLKPLLTMLMKNVPLSPVHPSDLSCLFDHMLFAERCICNLCWTQHGTQHNWGLINAWYPPALLVKVNNRNIKFSAPEIWKTELSHKQNQFIFIQFWTFLTHYFPEVHRCFFFRLSFKT